MTGELPGFWRFAWMFFMQPVLLHQLLKDKGIAPSSSAWSLLRNWRQRTEAERWWLMRSVAALAILPFSAFPLTALLDLSGLRVDYSRMAGIVVFCMAVGAVFCVGLGVAVGVALGASFGASFGVAAGVAAGEIARVAAGMGIGVAIGMAVGVAGGMALGVTAGVAGGVAFGLAGGMAVSAAFGVALDVFLGVAVGGFLVMAKGVAVGVAGGVTASVAFGVAFMAASLRLPMYAAEMGAACAAWYLRRPAWSPVLYHDLSYLPDPYLQRAISYSAENAPQLTQRLLDACSRSRGQRRIGELAAAEIRAREIEGLIRDGRWVDLIELRGTWLPGVQGADPLLLAFSEAARFMAAARDTSHPHHRANHLRHLADKLAALSNQRRAGSEPAARYLETPLREFQKLAAHDLQHAEIEAARTLLNPFRTGNALSPEEGPELFVGREDTIRELESLLADPANSASLVLLAPRRCGKTSLLKMLPLKLPDTVSVFVDLQAHPLSSAASFFEAIAREAVVAGKRDRRIDIPPLPTTGPPLEAAARWLDKLEEVAGSRRILIQIDEFECLEDRFTGTREELLQLMGLLRATIQHRRHVRLLVSGVAAFDELSGIWNDHFINTQPLRLNFFDAATTAELLCRPAELIGPDVAAQVYARTGGQPYLVQMYGSKIITLLSKAPGGRRPATPDDVATVEPQVLEASGYYFSDTYEKTPADVKPALEALARGESTALPPRTRRWLERRNLLSPENTLAVPVLGAWIVDQLAYGRAARAGD